MQPRVSLITLGVHDLERAIRFYQDGLGLPRMKLDAPGVAFFTLDGSWLALYPWADLARDAELPEAGQGFRGVTLAHNVSCPEAVDEVLKEAVAAGARLVKPARKADWGGYSGYFADPDGHLWEVAWNPGFWPGPAERTA